MVGSAFHHPLRRLGLETSWLREEFFRCHTIQCRQSQLACEMAIIRLQDAWSRFCRELVILSAIGKTETIGGVILSPSPGVKNRSSVIPLLLSTYARRRYKPRRDRTPELGSGSFRQTTEPPTRRHDTLQEKGAAEPRDFPRGARFFAAPRMA